MKQKLVCRQKVRIEEEDAVREIFRKQQVEQLITTHYNFSSLRLTPHNASGPASPSSGRF